MPVLAKLRGIVIRMLSHPTFGTHLHAIYGESEFVIGLRPVRVIQGEGPSWVCTTALDWARGYENALPGRPQRIVVASQPSEARV